MINYIFYLERLNTFDYEDHSSLHTVKNRNMSSLEKISVYSFRKKKYNILLKLKLTYI